MKRWFLLAAARARGQSNDLNREILASILFNYKLQWSHKRSPVPSISRCIHIVYRHKNVWGYQWSNFIYNCMSTFPHYVHCKDALLDCSAPDGERWESLTRVDEILNLTSGFNRLGKDNCKMRQETVKFWDLVCLVLEVWWYLKFWLWQEIQWVENTFYMWISVPHVEYYSWDVCLWPLPDCSQHALHIKHSKLFFVWLWYCHVMTGICLRKYKSKHLKVYGISPMTCLFQTN